MEGNILVVYDFQTISQKAGNVNEVIKSLNRVRSVRSVNGVSTQDFGRTNKETFSKAVFFLRSHENVMKTFEELRNHCDPENAGEIAVVLHTPEGKAPSELPGSKILIKMNSLDDIANWWPGVLRFLFGNANLESEAKKKRCMFLFDGDSTSSDEQELIWYQTAKASVEKFGLKCGWLGDTGLQDNTNYKVVLSTGDGLSMWKKSVLYLENYGKFGKTVVFTDQKKSYVCKVIKFLNKKTRFRGIKDATFNYKRWIVLLYELNLIDADPSAMEAWKIVVIVLGVAIGLPVLAGMIMLLICCQINIFEYCLMCCPDTFYESIGTCFERLGDCCLECTNAVEPETIGIVVVATTDPATDVHDTDSDDDDKKKKKAKKYNEEV